MGPQNSNMITH